MKSIRRPWKNDPKLIHLDKMYINSVLEKFGGIGNFDWVIEYLSHDKVMITPKIKDKKTKNKENKNK